MKHINYFQKRPYARCLILIFGLIIGLGGCIDKRQIAENVPPLGYRESSIFDFAGYKDQKVGTSKFEIKYTGHAYTSNQRLYALAMMRAAKLGIENKKNYLKLLSAKMRYSCAQRTYSSRPAGDPEGFPTLMLLVEYSNQKKDAKYAGNKETFHKYKAIADKVSSTDERLKANRTGTIKCIASAPPGRI